jgi:hypothetical protein
VKKVPSNETVEPAVAVPACAATKAEQAASRVINFFMDTLGTGFAWEDPVSPCRGNFVRVDFLSVGVSGDKDCKQGESEGDESMAGDGGDGCVGAKPAHDKLK